MQVEAISACANRRFMVLNIQPIMNVTGGVRYLRKSIKQITQSCLLYRNATHTSMYSQD